MGKPSLILYDENTAPQLKIQEAADFLKATFSLPVEIRSEFITWHLAWLQGSERISQIEKLSTEFAGLRVRDANRLNSFSPPLPLEIDFERRRLLNDNQGTPGIIYDGFLLQTKLRDLLPREEANLQNLHIIFTNRLLATWEEDDRRYHLRTIILGQPAIISTSGLVEAPAKPREYYLARQRLPEDELSRAALRRELRGRFLEYDDPRLAEVVKGYLLQAAFYLFAGEAFCPDPDCRLFNAHWQEEMLQAQTRSEADLCAGHKELLAYLKTDLREK
jgi:hypothetical protein